MLATWGCTTFSKPTLDLQFVGATSLDNRITFTRASTATFFNSSGVLSTAASGEARFDYNPSTLAAQGLLIEEQRTNSIRNNTMVGAVAGTPGTVPTNWDITVSGSGITQQIVGTGVEDGITYIDVKFSGTGSGTAVPQIRPETTTQIVAAAGQSWASSWYLRIVGGSTTGCTGTFQQVWQERDAAGAALNTVTVGIADPTSAALKTQRSILTRTLTDAGTARLTNRIQWTFTNGVAVDITLRIGLPQLEQGAFATSVIPTTTTALTRNADVASMTGTNFSSWFNAATGTIYSEWNSFANSTNRYLVDIEQAASSNDRIDININSSNVVNPRTVVSGSAVATLTGGTYTVNTNAKIAFAYASADYASSFNGATAVTATTAGSLPSSLARMFIGSVAGSNFANGYIRRIAYYRVRLPNSTLQALTA